MKVVGEARTFNKMVLVFFHRRHTVAVETRANWVLNKTRMGRWGCSFNKGVCHP